eukprot:403338691
MVSADNTPEAMDFVLKILNVNGKKIRLQLWDIGGNTDPNTAFPNTAFTPLFIRNAIGCVIVAKSDDPKSLSNVIDWKTCFDYQTTASLYQTALPTMILINHFDSAEQSTFSTTPKIPQNKSFDQLELQIQTLLKGCSLHHVDSESGYGLDEAFESFIKVLMEDIEKCGKSQDDLLDEMWDESLKGKINRATKRLPKLSQKNRGHADSQTTHQISYQGQSIYTKNKDRVNSGAGGMISSSEYAKRRGESRDQHQSLVDSIALDKANHSIKMRTKKNGCNC